MGFFSKLFPCKQKLFFKYTDDPHAISDIALGVYIKALNSGISFVAEEPDVTSSESDFRFKYSWEIDTDTSEKGFYSFSVAYAPRLQAMLITIEIIIPGANRDDYNLQNIILEGLIEGSMGAGVECPKPFDIVNCV